MSAAPAVSISSGWWADHDRRAPPRHDDRAGGRGDRLHGRPRAARRRECSISPPVIVVFAAAIPLAVAERRAGLITISADYVVVDITGAWVILCTAIVYLLASIYSIGYMRLLGEDERLWGFYALFSGFALTILVELGDEQCRPLLDRHRTHDAGEHLPGRLRARGRKHRGGLEIHHHHLRRHQPRLARHRAVLLVRQLRARADLRHDLGRAARRRRRR